MNIGIAGLGTVGLSVVKAILASDWPVTITAVSARDQNKDRGVDLSSFAFETDPVALASRDDIDVVVELIGGEDGPALDLAMAALKVGKPLVTANKAMLAKHWAGLHAHNGTIKFEAAVAGGIPVIKVLQESMAGNTVRKISGILNGTCNYILSTMENEGTAFDVVLKDAQEKGFAEADPTLDIDGWDAAHKLTILTKMAFDAKMTLDDISVTGIRDMSLDQINDAKANGNVIRLIGSVERVIGKVVASVSPQILPMTHPLAGVGGAMNAVSIEAEPVQICTLIGPGAGGGPTASAVLSDILDLARA